MAQKDRRDVIKTLFDSGITSPVEICRRTDIPRMTVFRTLKLIRENKSLGHKQGTGRPSTITFRQKQSIITTLKRSPTMFIRDLRGNFAATHPNAPSTTTVYRTIRKSGIEETYQGAIHHTFNCRKESCLG